MSASSPKLPPIIANARNGRHLADSMLHTFFDREAILIVDKNVDVARLDHVPIVALFALQMRQHVGGGVHRGNKRRRRTCSMIFSPVRFSTGNMASKMAFCSSESRWLKSTFLAIAFFSEICASSSFGMTTF